jgi:hypothetical protein
MTDYDPNKPEARWHVDYCGGKYEITKDCSRYRTGPKWYVKRVNDRRYSKRFYSRPSGAFLALSEGAIVWEG